MMPVTSHPASTRRRVSLRALLASLVAATWLFATSVAPTSAASVTGADAVNIRECPSVDCEVLATAPLGAELKVTGQATGSFLPVSYDGVDGYAFDLYVSVPGEEAPWLTSGEPGCQRVALIFNIGIGDPPSERVVETLLDRDVPATMFAMGWWAEEQPDYLRRLADEGFVIGSHGHARNELTTLDDAAIVADLKAADEAIARVIGSDPEPWFTPYAAASDPRVRAIVADAGYLPVGWEVPAADYGADATAGQVYERVMNNIYDGAIVEMHLDGPATEWSTAEALPWIIDELRADGYDFVTVPDLAMPCA